MTKQRASLTDWYIFTIDGVPGMLFGKTKGHPRFLDGIKVRTSRILDTDEQEDGTLVVETKNTIYTLDPKERA